MATGKTHAIATVLAAGVFGPSLFWLGRVPLAESLCFAGGCMAGLLVNPDLDIRHFTHAEEVVRKSAGRFLAGLWYALWWPYAHLVPYHRHPASHFPLVGTFGRALYMALFFLFFRGLASLAVPLPPLSLPLSSAWLWWGLGGLAVVDTLHTLLDVI